MGRTSAATTVSRDDRRRIPSVGRLLAEPAVAQLFELYGREQVRIHVQQAVDRLRERLAAADCDPAAVDRWHEELPAALRSELERTLGPELRRVINATGVFLHTNLGRAPLPRSVIRRLADWNDAYCDLEIDLVTGRRGQRNSRCSALLRALTGAEAALVVNNNAAAMVLVLSALARGREVVVSRGELVEIGGSFRIPEILETAGARLVEVGTTNRTRIEDYRRALGEDTALLLKIFPSNYRIVGFTEAVDAAELAELGREHGVPVLIDEGSGLLRPHAASQLKDHPSVRQLLADGADLVCGSGDKLVGGPQAGLLAGRAELIGQCQKSPLYRAFRPSRLTLSALEGVLRRHLGGGELPIDRLWPEPEEHRRRLQRMAELVGAEIVAAEAFLGGGSAPEEPIEGEALALEGDDDLARRLRSGEPPVVGYLKDDRLILDLRTVDPSDDESLVAAVRQARSADSDRA